MTDVKSLPFAGEGFSVHAPGAVVANTIAGLPSEHEDALAKRYGKPKPKNQQLVFEFTRDPGLLHQYHRMYEAEFRMVQNAKNYHHVEDEHDRRASFLIVRQGKLCIGGGRLSSKGPRRPELLPMESGDFRIDHYFPHLKQKELTYGQVGRICLLPEFRGGDITSEMFRHINRKAAALGWETMFATAPILNARNNTKLCRVVGLEAKIHFDIEVPPYPMCEEIKMYFMTIQVNKRLAGIPDLAPEARERAKDTVA